MCIYNKTFITFVRTNQPIMSLSQHANEQNSLKNNEMNEVDDSFRKRLMHLMKTNNLFCLLVASVQICIILFYLAGFRPEEIEQFYYETQVEKGKIYEFLAPCEIVVSGNEWADFAEIDEENYVHSMVPSHFFCLLMRGIGIKTKT